MSHKNIVSALYQILTDEFSSKSEWRIDAKELAGKIPEINCKYPSHIVPLINPVVKKINKTTNLNVDLEIEKERGKATLIFLNKRDAQDLIEEPPKTDKPEKTQVLKKPGIKPWESYKTLLKDAFSLYHTTFIKIAQAEHLFLKWSEISEEEKDALMAELETKAWKQITQDAQRHMNTLSLSERKELEEKTSRVLSDYSADKKIVSMVAYLIQTGR